MLEGGDNAGARLPSFGGDWGDWGDWGLQSSHRRGCGPTKGSESLIRDGGLQSSHRRGCGPTKGSESLIRDGGL